MLYPGIVIVGGMFSFLAAMGIGANDVANAYATAVGSKALTVKQSVILATIFETSGAILMGSHVSKTIRKGIANYECFEEDAGPLMYGCMWVSFSVFLWLFLASKYEMPVSTTHSCVGGMIGMTMALKGPRCVNWYSKTDVFPYIGGVSGIILSWILSPLFSAMIASVIFGSVRAVILRSENSFHRTSYLFPIMIGGTITLNTFFIIYKGAKGLGLDETSFQDASIWAFSAGAAAALLIIPFTKTLKDKAENIFIQNIEIEVKSPRAKTPDENKNTICNYINKSLKVNLDEIIENETQVLNIHNNAEKFDSKTEEYFKYLQVFTAICDSFSHGANDVANAIGPFMAIYMISKEGTVDSENNIGSDAYWMLSIGGIGISLGLFLYGYKIIHAIGTKLCKITPSRGTSIELASAIVIITGSRLEIPLSTTHCQIGATIGVAALENIKTCSGINHKIMFKCILGWVLTLIIVGCTSAMLTAQGAYAPEVGVDDNCANIKTNHSI
jgi:sodium-dependent phosphate transporter